MLIRSDSVVHLNAAGREAMSAYGVATVLDLRSNEEVIENPSPYLDGAMARYVHRELIDDANMTHIGDSQSMFDRYLFIIQNRSKAFRDVFEAIADADGCVLFHCFAGKDRTGLVAAMALDLAGVPREHIAADYGETDLQLAPQYETWVAQAPADKRDAFRDELRCPPERILGVLDHLDDRWGGVATYLEAAGLSPVTIDRAASKLA